MLFISEMVKQIFRAVTIRSLGVMAWCLLFDVSTAAQKLHFTSNEPIGEAKGIYPGRVTWMRDAEVTRWNGHDGHWWDDGSIDQERLERMYDKSVCALTGDKTPKRAWKSIFTYFNKERGNGNRGYRKGEKIAIKINLNPSLTFPSCFSCRIK